METFHSANTQFKLEIDRLPVSVQTALEANGPLPPRERRELVRSTVDQLTKFCSRPRRELIKSVASAIVLKFPSALQDKAIGGHLLGRGYDSLFQQLENRVENIYRGKQPASPSNERKHQRSKKWSYGCIDWQPRRNLEHPQDIEEKINFLKQEGRKSLKDVNVPVALLYMGETYPEQRNFVNSDPFPTTTQVKEECPLLFKRPFFYQHSDKLLGKDVKASTDILL